MNLSELIAAVGDANVRFQKIDDMCPCQNVVLLPPDCRAVAILTAKEKANVD